MLFDYFLNHIVSCYLRRNSAQIIAVAVETFNDSDVGRSAG